MLSEKVVPPEPEPEPEPRPLSAEENRLVWHYLLATTSLAIVGVIILASAGRHMWVFLAAGTLLAPPAAVIWWQSLRAARKAVRK
jgi:hypothetical protein